MYYVYAISSIEKNYIYVGLTDNVERRFFKHNTGKNKTTKPYLPFTIIYTEEFETRIQARLREKYFKSGSGKEKIKIIRQRGYLVTNQKITQVWNRYPEQNRENTDSDD